jgi:hypothetical protein
MNDDDKPPPLNFDAWDKHRIESGETSRAFVPRPGRATSAEPPTTASATVATLQFPAMIGTTIINVDMSFTAILSLVLKVILAANIAVIPFLIVWGLLVALAKL